MCTVKHFIRKNCLKSEMSQKTTSKHSRLVNICLVSLTSVLLMLCVCVCEGMALYLAQRP